MRYLLLSVLVVCVIGVMIPSAFADHPDLQNKLYEYWSCAILSDLATCPAAKIWNDEDKSYILGIEKLTDISVYRVVDCRTVCNLSLIEHYDVDKKLVKFQNENMHKQFLDAYVSITPKRIMDELVYVSLNTDDYGGTESASVIRNSDYPLKFDVNIDPLDMVFDDFMDEQYLKAVMIHENAHILSLNSEEGNNDALFMHPGNTGSYIKELMLKKHADCAPNYYNDMAGCLYPDSYLNLFFQKFWAEIYPDHHWWWEFYTMDMYYYATDEFYQKYKTQFVTYYAASDPDEDFAESF